MIISVSNCCVSESEETSKEKQHQEDIFSVSSTGSGGVASRRLQSATGLSGNTPGPLRGKGDLDNICRPGLLTPV